MTLKDGFRVGVAFWGHAAKELRDAAYFASDYFAGKAASCWLAVSNMAFNFKMAPSSMSARACRALPA